jgi:hypothetical protein
MVGRNPGVTPATQDLPRLRYILPVSDVFYLRPITPPVTPGTVLDLVAEAGDCYELHRVVWTLSFLAADGGRMLCWYRAPDAESARLALKALGSDLNGVWPGMVIGDVSPGDEAISRINALAEISFDQPLPGGHDEIRKRLGHGSLRDTVAGGFLSNDRRRMIGLWQAPDVGAVRAALAATSLPVQSVWPCTVIAPPRPGH